MSRDCCVTLPRGAMVCLQFVIVVFPDHTHLLFLNLQQLCLIVPEFADYAGFYQGQGEISKVAHTRTKELTIQQLCRLVADFLY